MAGRRAGAIEESLNAIGSKTRRRRQIPGKNMITLNNILNETSQAVLKVIQGPLAGFLGKNWRMHMQLMLDLSFPAWGLVPRSAARSEVKNGDRSGLTLELARRSIYIW